MVGEVGSVTLRAVARYVEDQEIIRFGPPVLPVTVLEVGVAHRRLLISLEHGVGRRLRLGAVCGSCRVRVMMRTSFAHIVRGYALWYRCSLSNCERVPIDHSFYYKVIAAVRKIHLVCILDLKSTSRNTVHEDNESAEIEAARQVSP